MIPIQAQFAIAGIVGLISVALCISSLIDDWREKK